MGTYLDYKTIQDLTRQVTNLLLQYMQAQFTKIWPFGESLVNFKAVF